MTHRIDYREKTALTDSEHDTVVSSVATWADNGQNRRFPFYQRNRDQDESEIHVVVSGVNYTDIPTVLENIRNGLDTLPGEWPDATNNAKTTPE